jgi:3',5'-cyclic AMP phosphodiesterase CpdA
MVFGINKLLLVASFLLISCEGNNKAKQLENIKIAFMSDVHLQDIYATFSDTDYKGIKNPLTGEYNTIRTMEAQLHSTRLFNENYFAFLAALEDAAQKGIKIIALPGDFSDDGQPMNVRALRKILDTYSKKYNITFLVITGNHDPGRPFAQDAGKKDFLGEGGQPQAILSKQGNMENSGLQPIITQDVKEWGYAGILNELSDFGFFPKEKFHYWETPFSSYDYENYTLEKALVVSGLNQRQYPISENLVVPDASYLVEPQEGVWLLALDANVYVPVEGADSVSQNPKNYSGASTGYNNVLTHKRHLIQWVGKVAKEAQKRGKTLIAFSHYPMVEFNDGTSELKKALFGSNKMQLHRVPREDVAKAFADAGLKVHFGGHMHINDTGIHKTKKGNVLINVQTPSLAAYPAAYKILTIKPENVLEVETVPLTAVSRFTELFPMYQEEYRYLVENNEETIWNNDILGTETYREYVTWHLRELVRLRFIPDDWPSVLKEHLLKQSGKQLLVTATDSDGISQIQSLLAQQELTFQDFESWTGLDMIFDFYRLHNGDELALEDIGEKRIRQYKLVLQQLVSGNPNIKDQLHDFAEIFEKQFEGAPSDSFRIDLNKGAVQTLLNN